MKRGQIFLIYLIFSLFVNIGNVSAFSRSNYYLTTNATSFSSLLNGTLKEKFNYKVEFKSNFSKREYEIGLSFSVKLDYLLIGKIESDKRVKPLFKEIIKLDEVALNKKIVSSPIPFSLLNNDSIGSFVTLFQKQLFELFLFSQMPQQDKNGSFVIGSFITTKAKMANVDAAFAFFDNKQINNEQFLIDSPFLNNGAISYFDLIFDEIRISKLKLKVRLFAKFIYENSLSLYGSSLFRFNFIYDNINLEIEKYNGSINDDAIKSSTSEKYLNSLRTTISSDFKFLKIEFRYFDFLYKKPIYAGHSQKREVLIAQNIVHQNRYFSCSLEGSYQKKWTGNGGINEVYRFYFMGETKIKSLSLNLSTSLKYDKYITFKSSVSLKFPLNNRLASHVLVEMQDTIIKLRITLLFNFCKESLSLVLNDSYNNGIKYSTSL